MAIINRLSLSCTTAREVIMQSSGKLWSGLLLFSLLGLLAGPVVADNMRYALDPTHTQVSVHWDHLGFSKPGAYFVISEGSLIWNNEVLSESSHYMNITLHVLYQYRITPFYTT